MLPSRTFPTRLDRRDPSPPDATEDYGSPKRIREVEIGARFFWPIRTLHFRRQTLLPIFRQLEAEKEKNEVAAMIKCRPPPHLTPSVKEPRRRGSPERGYGNPFKMPIKITEEEWIPAQEKFESSEDFRSFTDARASRKRARHIEENGLEEEEEVDEHEMMRLRKAAADVRAGGGQGERQGVEAPGGTGEHGDEARHVPGHQDLGPAHEGEG